MFRRLHLTSNRSLGGRPAISNSQFSVRTWCPGNYPPQIVIVGVSDHGIFTPHDQVSVQYGVLDA